MLEKGICNRQVEKGRPNENTRRRHLQPREEATKEETNPADTLILNL